jgi:hypothetical protein
MKQAAGYSASARSVVVLDGTLMQLIGNPVRHNFI